MSLRLALLLALVFGVLIAYLTSLDSAGVRVALAGGPAYDLPMLILLVGTLLVGATLGLVLGMLRDVGRSYRDRREARRVSRARTPGHLAQGLGRAYFELAMLDEAAEQFQKLEVQAPDLPAIHAYLGAIFERHGQSRAAFEEYRRALRFPERFEWPHRCVACGATEPSWFDRCASCRRWNTSRP